MKYCEVCRTTHTSSRCLYNDEFSTSSLGTGMTIIIVLLIMFCLVVEVTY